MLRNLQVGRSFSSLGAKTTPNVRSITSLMCTLPHRDRMPTVLLPRYITNISMIGTIAQQEHGAIVVLEHRFFGESNPFPDLSEEHLPYLTIQKAINDLIYFAQNVDLPMAGGSRVGPEEAPWILVGGSYAGEP